MNLQSVIHDLQCFIRLVVPVFQAPVGKTAIFMSRVFGEHLFKFLSCQFGLIAPGVKSPEKNANIRIIGAFFSSASLESLIASG